SAPVVSSSTRTIGSTRTFRNPRFAPQLRLRRSICLSRLTGSYGRLSSERRRCAPVRALSWPPPSHPREMERGDNATTSHCRQRLPALPWIGCCHGRGVRARRAAARRRESRAGGAEALPMRGGGGARAERDATRGGRRRLVSTPAPAVTTR